MLSETSKKEKLFVLGPSNQKIKISLYNLIGKLILETNSDEIDVSSLTSGCYIIKLSVDNKTTKIQKLIIE